MGGDDGSAISGIRLRRAGTGQPAPGLTAVHRTTVGRIVTLVAGVVAVMIVAGVPLGFWTLQYRNVVSTLASEARTQAALVSDFVGRNSTVWPYAQERISAGVASVRDSQHETRILDLQGSLVLDLPAPLDWPSAAVESPFFDFGRPAGTLVVRASLREALEQTLLVLALSALFGGIVFFPLRRIPLRALSRAHAEILQREREQRTLVDGLLEGVLLIDDAFSIRAANPSASRILGLSQGRLIGSRLDTVFENPVAEDGTPLPVNSWPLKQGAGADPGQDDFVVGLHLSEGAVSWLSLKFQSMKAGAQPGNRGTVVSFENITERVSAERRIRELAHYDSLTGLPNRSLLREMLGRAIGGARRRGTRVAVLFIDLDHFKTINDTMGHHTGDAVLAEVGRRVKEALRQEDIASRLGGDEFVAAIPDLDDAGEAALVADKLMRRLGEPFAADGREFLLTPSIGIAIFPEDGVEIDTLLSNADTAMYCAKENGRAAFRFFAPDMNSAARQRMELNQAVRQALRGDEFILYYQPQIDAGNGSVVGVEALLRWRRSGQGIVEPAAFIPVVEGTRLIVEIGEWVLREAMRQRQDWSRRGVHTGPIAINVSPLQFRQDEFAELLERLAAEAGPSAGGLDLELTETMMVDPPDSVLAKMRRAKELGFGLALDDFGAGYSGLGYLTRFPFDKLKIDQSFVHRAATDSSAAAIVDAVVALAHAIGLKVLAEGIETEEQSSLLRAKACDQLQGFLIAPPMTSSGLEDWLAANGSGESLSPAAGFRHGPGPSPLTAH
jgi:diguanylate cyclase (GGDEF)-like protein/PAS domain S-box-containing protein